MRIRDVAQDALETGERQREHAVATTKEQDQRTFWKDGPHSGMPLTLYQYNQYLWPPSASRIPASLMVKKLFCLSCTSTGECEDWHSQSRYAQQRTRKGIPALEEGCRA